MLDNLLWLKEKDGDHKELTLKSLVKVSPEELLGNIEKIEKTESTDEQACAALLHFIGQQVHEPLEAGETGDALEEWLCDFAPALEKRQSWAQDWANPVILLAATFNKTAALHDLLRAGGNKNAEGEDGRTALMLATQGGHTEAVKLLINADANKEALNKTGETALLIAARNGHVGTLEALLKAGANMEALNRNGETALLIAARSGHVGTLEALLKAGANMEALNRNGESALMLVARNGHVGTLEALLAAGAGKDTKDNMGKTALMLAASNGQVETLEALLAAGADKEAVDHFNGQSALMLAASNGHVGTLEALLAAGADKEAVDFSEDTALILAARDGQVGTLEALLAAGAVKDAKNINKNTALILAACYGQVGILDVLIKAGAGMEALNMKGQTALMVAATKGHVAAAKVLIPHDANGINALMSVASDDNDDEEAIKTAAILLEAGADGVTTLLDLARQGFHQGLERLIKAGADKAKNAQGKTALMRAIEMTAASGNDSKMALKALEALLLAGADTEVKDNEGKTPKAHAVELANLGNEKALLVFEASSQKSFASWLRSWF